MVDFNAYLDEEDKKKEGVIDFNAYLDNPPEEKKPSQVAAQEQKPVEPEKKKGIWESVVSKATEIFQGAKKTGQNAVRDVRQFGEAVVEHPEWVAKEFAVGKPKEENVDETKLQDGFLNAVKFERDITKARVDELEKRAKVVEQGGMTGFNKFTTNKANVAKEAKIIEEAKKAYEKETGLKADDSQMYRELTAKNEEKMRIVSGDDPGVLLLKEKETLEVYDQFLENSVGDRGFIGAFIGTVKNPINLLPFVKDVIDTAEFAADYRVLKRYEKGEKLDEVELARINNLRADGLKKYIQVGMGDKVGELSASMIKYVLEFALTSSLYTAGKTAVLKGFGKTGATIIAKESLQAAGEEGVKFTIKENAARIVSGLIGSMVQTVGFVPTISKKTAEYMLPEYDLLSSKDGQVLFTKIDEGDSFAKAVAKAGLTTYIDTATERAGFLVEDPLSFTKKAILGKYLAKMGVKDATTFAKVANVIAWDGIIGEVFEEELAEVLEAPIEERKYYVPFTTPEGTERFWVETLGITAFGGLAKGVSAVVDAKGNLTTNRKMEGDTIDISDIAPEENISVAAEAKAGWGEPGTKATFDAALLSKDAATVTEMLPLVPAEYKVRFAKEIAAIAGETVYRAVDSTNKETTLGEGKYFAFEEENVKRYGKDIQEFRLSPEANMLDLTNPSELTNFENEARDNNKVRYAKLVETVGAEKAHATIVTEYAEELGYDGIKGDDAAFGSVVFNDKLLVKPGKAAGYESLKGLEADMKVYESMPEGKGKELAKAALENDYKMRVAEIEAKVGVQAEAGFVNPSELSGYPIAKEAEFPNVNVEQEPPAAEEKQGTSTEEKEEPEREVIDVKNLPEEYAGTTVAVDTNTGVASYNFAATEALDIAAIAVKAIDLAASDAGATSIKVQVPEASVAFFQRQGYTTDTGKVTTGLVAMTRTLKEQIEVPTPTRVSVPGTTKITPTKTVVRTFQVRANPNRISYMGPQERSDYYVSIRNELVNARTEGYTTARVGVRTMPMEKAINLYQQKAQSAIGAVGEVPPVPAPKKVTKTAQKKEVSKVTEAKEKPAEGKVEAPKKAEVEKKPVAEPKVEHMPKIPAPSGYASYPSMEEGKLKTPNEVRSELGLKRLQPIKFPEIIRVSRTLLGQVPSIKEPRARSIGVPAGYFTPEGGGKITLNPVIFNDAALMEQVLAHELGHAIDYLPEGTMARGNLLGRMASLRNFLRETFTDLETEAKVDELIRKQSQLQSDRADLKNDAGEITDKKRYEALGKELTPINKEIDEIKQSAKYKYKEIYEELKAVTQLWNPFDEVLTEERAAKIAKQRGISPLQVQFIWAKYVTYRYSGKELYAEAMSALFNMPDVLKEKAPKFYEGFFENLDRKPEVLDNFLKIQELLAGGDAVLSERQKEVRDSFQKGEDIVRVQREEIKNRNREYTFRLKYELLDKNQRVIDKVKQAQKEGKVINPDDNPVFWLEAHNYIGGIVKNYMEDYIQPVYKKVQDAGLVWEDLGEVLFLERVIKERGDIPNPIGFIRDNDQASYDQIKDDLPEGIESKSTTEQLAWLKKEYSTSKNANGDSLYDELISTFPLGIANPFGMTNETAQEQMDHLEKQVGAEKWKTLQEALKSFRNATNYITELAAKEKFWKPELLEKIKANPAYATFQVLDYLREYIPASISHQVGTLKDIANPADATAAKSMSIIKAIERNKVKKAIVNFMKKNFPEEITEAKYGWNGRFRIPLEPKDATKQALFTTIEDGATTGYYVDPYIAKTMEYSSAGEANAVMEVFKLFNSKMFRPLFITFNVGFQSFNLMRDFFRYYKNIPNMSLFRAAKSYITAAPIAYRRAWNIPDATIKEMEQAKILGVTYNDVIRGATTEDKRIDAMLARAGVTVLKGKQLPALLRPIKAILDVIENTGNMIETLPKVAAYRELNGTMPKEQLASTIRTSVGSPDFLRKGASYKVYNEVFLFSNAIKEGIRTDAAVATNPNTRVGWWFKTAKLNIIPKMLMFAAMSGLFGEWLRKLFANVSEYDMTNYTIIPIGMDETGKTIYIRVPQDESGRLVGGIFWKTMRTATNNRPILKDAMDLMSFTGGQLPTVNPLITALTGASQYLAGQNPYDSFRGRYVIPDAEFAAGGAYAFKPFANWMLQNIGLGTIMSGYVSEQAPETKTWIQKVVETPVLSNIVGRWIKVSDYGKSEKNQQIVKNEEQATAQRQLEERRKLDDAVKEYQKGPTNITRKGAIELQLVKDIVGEGPYSGTRQAKVTNLRKKFNIAIIKGTADSNITSLIYANTNAEKMALLREIKGDMPADEFQKLKVMLVQEKIVSKDVFAELEKK